MDKEHNDPEQRYVCQKTDIIGQLAGGISHNFNNQLTGIMGFANLISMRSTDDNIKKFAQEIIGICKNAGDMVRELLTFARYKPHCADGISVHQSIVTVTNLLANSLDKKITIKHEFNADDYVVTADPVQFQSILLNLALNSKDAMPSGGSITFTTENVNGDKIKIIVSDTGSGFCDKVKERLFEPFFTTKTQGHIGLGLSSVSEFVKSMYGEIEVESAEGKGTSVIITLPNRVVGENLAESGVKSCNSVPAGGKKKGGGTILLVDDDKGIRDSVYAFLRGLGYSVVTACDGLDAVEKYRLAHDGIDLVIIDMVMPYLCGKDAFIKMKEINPEVKAIGITGFTKYSPEEMTAIGMKKILHKPFSFDDLSELIEKHL